MVGIGGGRHSIEERLHLRALCSHPSSKGAFLFYLDDGRPFYKEKTYCLVVTAATLLKAGNPFWNNAAALLAKVKSFFFCKTAASIAKVRHIYFE
jgi:hypothetical protein